MEMKSFISEPWKRLVAFERSKGRLFWLLVVIAATLGVAAYDSRLSSNPEDWRIRGDLTRFTLAASRLMLSGQNPYDADLLQGNAYRYFPLNAVVYAPLTWVPIPLAQGFWVAVNLVLLIWALRVHRALAGLARAHAGIWIFALLIGFRFIKDNFQLGQWNLPVYSLTVLGLWVILCKKRPWCGGWIVALAASLKFMPIAFVAYFAVKRQWRPTAAILLGVVFWILLFPALCLGFERHNALFHAYFDQGVGDVQDMMSERLATGHSLLVTVYAYLTPTLKHSAHKLDMQINLLSLEPQTAEHVALGVCILLVVLTLAVFWRKGGDTAPGRRTILELGILFMVMLLISPEARKAQLLTVFTPAFALAAVYWSAKAGSFEKRLSLGTIVLGVVLILVSSSLGKDLGIRPYALSYGSLTLLLLTHYGALMLLHRRQPDPPSSSGRGVSE